MVWFLFLTISVHRYELIFFQPQGLEFSFVNELIFLVSPKEPTPTPHGPWFLSS